MFEILRVSCKCGMTNPGPEVIKLFSCSVENEILDAHKYKNIKKFGIF